ncbi:hypothetical protein [Mycobacterium sp.]|uniref:hypothetical protein n=1 Tax=Mycobacterium sp. TaxID=1785 RepID=UPI003F9B8A2E
MTSPRRGTDRPFTVIVCAACAADHNLSVIDELRPTIRRCPHAMLVSAACLSNDQNLWVRRDVAHVSELVDWRSAMPVA